MTGSGHTSDARDQLYGDSREARCTDVRMIIHCGDRGAAGHDWVRVTSPNRSQGSTAKILVPGGPFRESCSSLVTSGHLVGDTGQVSSVTLGHLDNDME